MDTQGIVMWICLALLELLCTPTSWPAADSIYWQGFDEMYISSDRPSAITWTIDSDHHNAAFVTSSTYLNDGKVATPTRMTWDVGSQNVTIQTVIKGSFSAKTFAAGSKFVIFAACPKTPYAIPAGVIFQYALTIGGVPTAVTGSGVTAQTNDGAVVAIVVGTINSTLSPDGFNFTILNDTVGGITWAASGQTFDIGEIWFGSLQEFKNTADPSYGLTDPTTNRRSHNNTPWPLFIKPYRVWTFNFTPMNNAAAYTGSNNFDAVRYSLSTAEAALVLPRIYNPGTTTQNTVDIAQFATFGRPDSIDPLVGVRDAQGLWTAKMVFSEAPP